MISSDAFFSHLTTLFVHERQAADARSQENAFFCEKLALFVMHAYNQRARKGALGGSKGLRT